MSKTWIDYCGFDPDILHTWDGDFAKDLRARLPEGAVFALADDSDFYWMVTFEDEYMYVLYDDEASVEYDEGTPWAVVAIAVLDFMDEIAMKSWGEPARQTDED